MEKDKRFRRTFEGLQKLFWCLYALGERVQGGHGTRTMCVSPAPPSKKKMKKLEKDLLTKSMWENAKTAYFAVMEN